MDNASKALVMAGAILIAVMLISLGVVLFNSTSDIAKDTSEQLDSFSVEIYNSGYIQMTGLVVKGTTVKTLVNKINSHNNNAIEVAKYGTILIATPSFNSVGKINPDKYYTVDVTSYDYTTGAIRVINIKNERSTP